MIRICFYVAACLLFVTKPVIKKDDNGCRRPGQTLQQYFKWTPGENKPLIMAHRMSPLRRGYADNGFETLKYTYRYAPCVIQEMDVRMSKDSALLLLHDSTLNRTTTGKENLNKFLLKEVEQFELKDAYGNILKGQHVPLLTQVLQFVKKNKMIIALDMKPGTDPERLMKAVIATKTINDIFVICYTVKDAVALNKKYPTLMMALGFNSWDNIRAIEQSGSPHQNLIALTPSKLQDKNFYDKIHDMGIMVSFSAQGGADILPNNELTASYKGIFSSGGDIICTDSLKQVFTVFN